MTFVATMMGSLFHARLVALHKVRVLSTVFRVVAWRNAHAFAATSQARLYLARVKMMARFTRSLHGAWRLAVTRTIFALCHAGLVALHEFWVAAAVFGTLAGSFFHTLAATLHAFCHTLGITMLTSMAS